MSYSDFLEALDTDASGIWAERPVPLEEFIYSKDFLGHPPLSEVQYQISESMTQILNKETLVDLYGEEEAERLWKVTKKDQFLLLSKGSGKNTIAQICLLYVVYLMLCMKSPQEYYGLPTVDNIDLVNMATSSRQAVNSFFNKFKGMVKSVRWFDGKWKERTNDLRFDHMITVHSLHSVAESAEGLNILFCVLDEVDSPEIDGEEMFNYLSGTVTSRFEILGKVVCLSFARSADGFIMSHYDDAVAEKKVHELTHTYKLNNDLPDGIPSNEFTIRWEEDEVLSYKYDNVLAVKYPAYKVNPRKTLETYKMDCYRNYDDAMMRFFAMAPDAEDDAFFKNHHRINEAFTMTNGYDSEVDETVLETDKPIYLHVDLARQNDRAAVAGAHVETFQQVQIGEGFSSEVKPIIHIDFLRYWTPSSKKDIELSEIRDYIVSISKRYNIAQVTFDRWGSYDMIQYLNSIGITAVRNSLAIQDYNEMHMALGESRLKGPCDELLIQELKDLVLKNGKVDHRPGKHNDMAEAICGAIAGCIEKENSSGSVEFITLSDLNRRAELSRHEERAIMRENQRRPMPDELSGFIDTLYEMNGL